MGFWFSRKFCNGFGLVFGFRAGVAWVFCEFCFFAQVLQMVWVGSRFSRRFCFGFWWVFGFRVGFAKAFLKAFGFRIDFAMVFGGFLVFAQVFATVCVVGFLVVA